MSKVRSLPPRLSVAAWADGALVLAGQSRPMASWAGRHAGGLWHLSVPAFAGQCTKPRRSEGAAAFKPADKRALQCLDCLPGGRALFPKAETEAPGFERQPSSRPSRARPGGCCGLRRIGGRDLGAPRASL